MQIGYDECFDMRPYGIEIQLYGPYSIQCI